jgi:hypothetical protein
VELHLYLTINLFHQKEVKNVAKKEKLGKTNSVLINTPSGTVLEGNPDLEGLEKLYSEWASALGKVSGDDVFMVNEINLFQMFLKQGVTGRLMGNPMPNNQNEGGVEIDRMIRNIIDGGEIEISEIDELTKLKELMDEYSDDEHDNNPRNILFTDKEIDSTSGKVVNEEEIYGHYRTDNYQEKREFKNMKRREKGLPELAPMPACPSSWYGARGTSTPPFWQVIYGRGGEVKIANTKSLHEIVEQAIEELEKPLGTSEENPIVLGTKGQKGWAKKILEINSIRRLITVHLNPNMATPAGNFPHKKVRDLILGKEWTIPRRKDFQDRVRQTLGIPETLTVNRGYFKISRGVINQAAVILLDEKNQKYELPKTGRKDNTVKLKNFSEEKKTSFNQPVRSWADILKVT